MEYINRLDNYDGLEIAKMAQGDEFQLYDEALVIYKKINEPLEAIKILLYKQNNLKGANEFAEKTNISDVFYELGKAYIDQNMVREAIDAFIKANNANMFMRVIGAA